MIQSDSVVTRFLFFKSCFLYLDDLLCLHSYSNFLQLSFFFLVFILLRASCLLCLLLHSNSLELVIIAVAGFVADITMAGAIGTEISCSYLCLVLAYRDLPIS